MTPRPYEPDFSDALPTIGGGVDLLSRNAPPAGPGANDASVASDAPRSPGPFGDSPGDPPARAPGTPDLPSVEGFEVTAPLGAGGMGTVWRARQLSTRREVALKLLSLSWFGSERARRRFDREVELASRVQHPHIARVYDSGVRLGVYFYAMELIDGLPLDAYVRRNRLGPREILVLMRLVCRAIDHAHRHGVIHRDLKPSNILVDEAGDPHLLDFGLAKSYDLNDADSTISVEGDLAGTPAFMSPEQAACRDELVNTRSDVYSLGVILYRLLTGASPHELSGTQYEVLRRISHEDVIPPRKAAPHLDRELEAILLKALARNGEDRYSSAAAMADDLGNYLSNEPLTARAPSTFYFLRKRLYKHRLPLAAAASAVVLLLALGAYHAHRLAAERDLAVLARIEATGAKESADRARLAEAHARRDSEQSRAAEAAARRQAEAEAVDLAYSLAAAGDPLAAEGHWPEALGAFEEVDGAFRRLGINPFVARLCLADAERSTPPSLASLAPRAGEPDGPASPEAATPVDVVGMSSDGRVVRAVKFGNCLESWGLDGRAPDATAFPSGRAAAMTRAAMTADGRFAAVVLTQEGHGSRAALWELVGGKETAGAPLAGDLTSNVALSADGRLAAFATAVPGGGETLWLWDVDKRELKPAGWDSPPVHRLVFSPDGRTLFTADRKGMLRACDPAANKSTPLDPLPVQVTALAIGNGGRTLLGTDGHGYLGTWDVATGARGPAARRAGGAARAIAISPTGPLTASGDADGWIQVRDASSPGRGCLARLRCGASVASLAFSADGRMLLAGDKGGAVKVWNLAALGAASGAARTPPTIAAAPGGTPGNFTCLALSPDGRLLAWGDSTGHVTFCDRATGRTLASFLRPDPIARVAFSADGTTATAVDLGGAFCALDVAAAAVKECPEVGHRVWSADLSLDGRTALAGDMGILQLIDTATGEVLQDWDVGDKVIGAVALSGGGNAALYTDLNGKTTCLDVVTRRERWTIKTGPARSLAFTADDTRALIGQDDGMLTVVDAVTGGARPPISAHSAAVTALAAGPDGRTALSTDGATVRLWDLNTGRRIHEMFRAPGSVRCLLAASDGRMFAWGGAGADGAWLWDLSGRQAARDRAAAADAARATLAGRGVAPSDEAAKAGVAGELGAWYAWQGEWDWAAPLLRRAASGRTPAGAAAPAGDLAWSLWGLGDAAGAAQAFGAARLASHDPPEQRYFQLCEAAARREGAMTAVPAR